MPLLKLPETIQPFSQVAQLQALQEELGRRGAPTALASYGAPATGGFSELSSAAPATPGFAAPTGGGDIVDRLMRAVRTKESNGNYKARGKATKYGIAEGAYQFLPTTYANFAKQVGVNPTDWSPASQDKVARHALSTYLRQFGNDPRKVAIAWYAGPGAVTRSAGALNARQSAGGRQGNMPSINDYANAILKLMG